MIDQQKLAHNLTALGELKRASGCKLLYSIKALPLQAVLQQALPYVDGFSVSSLFEARFASTILAGTGDIHLTTPGMRVDECEELAQLCTHISFNSLSQQQRLSLKLEAISCGLRVNPKLSFLDDNRFDPCRPVSKLGVDIRQLEQHGLPTNIQGLHWHTVFSCKTVKPMQKTIARMQGLLAKNRARLEWINLGGGYLYPQMNDYSVFIALIQALRRQFKVDVFIEPGKAVVGDAGFLVSEVIDCFESDGKNIAVLDSSVNQHPEIFEYQKSPALHFPEHGEQAVVLAGSSCLAGDVFGEYHLACVPKVGDKIIFKDVGAYSLIKANRFNGYPLPDIYGLLGEECTHLKQDSYAAFYQQWNTGGG